MNMIHATLTASIAALSLLPGIAQAVYTGFPSYSTYGSGLTDFNTRMDNILNNYEFNSDLSNLRWQLNDVNSNLSNVNSQLNSIRNQQSLNSLSRLLNSKMQ